MIHEENKKQQPKTEDFSIENFLGSEKKKTEQEVTHQVDFAKPEIDEEAMMRVMAGEEPTETEQTRPSANTVKRTTSKPKKLTKEDYCGQFFKFRTLRQAKANQSMFGRNTTKHSTGLQTLWVSTNSQFMRI